MIRIGINGFGRIGRVLARQISSNSNFKIVLINEINKDLKNFSYLLKYDSIYGRFDNKVTNNNKQILIRNNKINFTSFLKIQDAPWTKNKVDVIIDTSGSNENLKACDKVLRSKVKKIIITNSPNKHVDFTMIMGVNEKNYNHSKHNLISSSICDASAIAPILKSIHEKFGIQSGFITTLHSRLFYQNMLDGPVQSVSSPGHNWKDYSLGRNSLASLIPKKTTAIEAISRCLPNLKNKIAGLSFRVPTAIVCGSDLTLNLTKKINTSLIKNFLKDTSKKNPKLIEFQTEALVSIDHLKTTKAAVIDANYIDTIDDSKMLKLVLWYDNEWGYCSRVIDILNVITKK